MKKFSILHSSLDSGSHALARRLPQRISGQLTGLSGRLISATLLLSVLVSSCGGGAPTAQAPPPTPVELQEVKASTVQDSSEFVGALEAQNRVELRPEVDGRIVQIFVAPGQSVAAGEPIAELKADRNVAQVTGAAADVDAAVAARNTTAAQLQAAQADVEKAQADVALQNTEYRRTASLVSEGAQAQQTLDQAANQRDTALAALKAAQEQVRANQAALSEADARLSSTQAAQDVATTDLDDNLVRAPIAGVVGNVPAKVGDYAQTDTTITSIIQNGALDLNLSVPIERTVDLRTGLAVELLDQQGKPLTTGRISFVSPEVNATDQAVLAKATFPNNGRLKDGQLVRAKIIWQTSPGILVPTNAITRIAGQTFVYVAGTGSGEKPEGAAAETPAPTEGQPQQVAQQRLVRLGDIQGNSYQVLEGLKPGEQIVVSGILNLQDGSPITVAQAQPVGAQQPQ
ncbi:MAG: efflux RND transporter periplasmic adaptor subunit [Oscillatoriophycideae cyanobacterium NC_groundwater_1537_Pr4_S-0.65um_50_18]|nr:efflux RND transporter periplasmic adaptor subunit [Oscillatoriophycideae cyanobacterium NC_groundwater_1537_Pr4_S-0.65um_50_18]